MQVNHTPITIVIADDHPISRLGLSMMFNSLPEFKLVGEAANGKELVDIAKKLKPDIIVTDIRMPVMNGIESTKQIVKLLPATGIIALSIVDKEYEIAEMLEAGAKGYLLKDAAIEEVITAIKMVYAGEIYFSNLVTANVTKMVAKGNYSSYKKPKPQFSEKEIGIIKLISLEFSNKEIAEKLKLPKRSVERSRDKIMHKLGAKNSAGIVIYAIENNLSPE